MPTSLPRPASQTLPPAWQHALQRRSDVSRTQARVLVTLMAGAHIAGAWALMQVPAVREAVRQVAPMMVDLVAPPAPPQTPTSPPKAPPLRPQSTPAPLLAAPIAAAVPAPITTALPPAERPSEPVAAASITTDAPPAPPSPPPPARKAVAATAVQYLVLPPVEVPRAARRAGESGVVWLRVVVDVRGLPAQIHVHRSSGHARLDEQAVWAMRQARFKPQTENGAPIELEVTAPIDYPLE